MSRRLPRMIPEVVPLVDPARSDPLPRRDKAGRFLAEPEPDAAPETGQPCPWCGGPLHQWPGRTLVFCGKGPCMYDSDAVCEDDPHRELRPKRLPTPPTRPTREREP